MADQKMQLLGTIRFGQELVAMDVQAADNRQAIVETARLLVDAGCVAPTYPDAVWEREQSFPTGLALKDCCVAIPHAESVHVKESALAVGVLRDPVEFQLMGEDGKSGAVKLLVMLAIRDPDRQIDMLQNLMALFQRDGAVQSILQCSSCEQVAANFAAELQAGGG